MTKQLNLVLACLLVLLISQKAFSQPEFKYGLGAGINLSNITETNTYPLYEDITGNEYSNTYSSMLSNIGSQFFFHGEFWYNKFIIAFKPGISTLKFKKTDQILFDAAPVEQTNAYLLRYFQIPIEVKIAMGSGKLKPYIGGAATYGQLLQQGGAGTHSFIHPRITAAPIVGAYYSLSSVDFVLTAGYNIGLHSITKQSDRYNTGSSTPYAQSDIKLNDLFITLSILFSFEELETRGALDCPTTQRGKTPKQKKVKRK